jgi:hypothetical protein
MKHVAKNIKNLTFTEETFFERCNIIDCTFSAACHFDRCNVIGCTGTDICTSIKSNIYESDPSTPEVEVLSTKIIDSDT